MDFFLKFQGFQTKSVLGIFFFIGRWLTTRTNPTNIARTVNLDIDIDMDMFAVERVERLDVNSEDNEINSQPLNSSDDETIMGNSQALDSDHDEAAQPIEINSQPLDSANDVAAPWVADVGVPAAINGSQTRGQNNTQQQQQQHQHAPAETAEVGVQVGTVLHNSAMLNLLKNE